ncbi:hypothetical protein Ccrd_008759 [Cynara cardunculus var. scolymus]|uniref:Uncharacterized protein n=1 Tax=Cynara cardunculus var. scolymus TaxID=59895 RepID=A0A103XEG9_CYNCS|nr:hypothetical protein Ccrd_008759 [Cynara cardunculus var. scolymus]
MGRISLSDTGWFMMHWQRSLNLACMHSLLLQRLLKKLASVDKMAKREVGSNVSEDLTRESLIAISYSLPDKHFPLKDLPRISNNLENVADAANIDKKEKCRAELISISYAESPDTKILPVKSKGQSFV